VARFEEQSCAAPVEAERVDALQSELMAERSPKSLEALPRQEPVPPAALPRAQAAQ
jgi:hypothetical protein